MPRAARITQLLALFPIWLLLVLNGTAPVWMLAIPLALVPLGVRNGRRIMLVLDPRGVTITRRQSRTVSWSDVVGFERGSRWLGGVRIRTTTGVVRSPVPCTDMGSRARPEQVAELEAFRLQSTARRRA